MPHKCAQLLGMQAYAIPAYQFDIKLCKTNRPPHSAVRAPGKFESPIIMEHVIEHVAARLDMDPVAVREINFLKAPPPGQIPCSLHARFALCLSHLALGCYPHRGLIYIYNIILYYIILYYIF